MAKRTTVKLLSMLLATVFVPSGVAFGFQDSQTRATEGASKSPRAAAIERRQPSAQKGKQQGPLPTQPWEVVSNNKVNEVGAVDGGVSADMLAVRGKEFDILAITAIKGLDVEGLRRLYESGATPAFDNTFFCRGEAYEKLPRTHFGQLIPDGRILEMVAREGDYAHLHTLPTSCSKLHMEYAAKINKSGLHVNFQMSRSPLAAAAYEEAPAVAAEDARWREIVALIDANTPAADKYLYPFYAALRIDRGDFHAALWFFRKWKEALPEIKAAEEMRHPARELLHKRSGLDGMPPTLWSGNTDYKLRSSLADFRRLRPWRDEAERPALLARRLAFKMAGQINSDQGHVCEAWKHAKAGVSGRGKETFKQNIPVEALDAMNRHVRWHLSELRDLVTPRPADEIDGETLSRWMRSPVNGRGEPLKALAFSPKADMLLLMRELLEFPGAKEIFLSLQDGGGNSILHSWANVGDGSRGPAFGSGLVTRWLLESGANPRLMNKAGDTPVSMAAAKVVSGRNNAYDRNIQIMKDAYLLKDYPEEFLCAEEVGDPGRK